MKLSSDGNRPQTINLLRPRHRLFQGGGIAHPCSVNLSYTIQTMKSTTTLWCGLLLLFPYFIWAQTDDWRTMMSDRTQNFYDIQRAYNQEMGNRPYEKGLGMKQYKRWEYYWESRVDEQGNFPRPGDVLGEMIAYYQRHNNQKSYLSGSGNWSILGPVPVPNNGTGQLNGNGRLN